MVKSANDATFSPARKEIRNAIDLPLRRKKKCHLNNSELLKDLGNKTQ